MIPPEVCYIQVKFRLQIMFFDIKRGRTGFDGDRCGLDSMPEMLVGSVKNEQKLITANNELALAA